MASSADPKTPQGAPWWAFAIAAALVAAWIVLWTGWTTPSVLAADDPAKAFVIVGTVFGVSLAVVLMAAAILAYAFRARWNTGRAALHLALLLIVGVTAQIFSIEHEDLEIRRTENAAQEAVDETVSEAADGFSNIDDSTLAFDALQSLRRVEGAPQIRRVRGLAISETRGERAVCGEASETGAQWVGFVVQQRRDGTLAAAIEQDGFSPAVQGACRPLIMKYLGEKNVDFAEADALFRENGCTRLDRQYWETHKRACYGRRTLPG